MLDDSDDASGVPATEAAIVADTDLTPEQKDALLAVYRSYRQANQV